MSKQKYTFELATREKRKARLLFYGDSGAGKAQPLYSKVLTPDGWVLMGDIEEGDEIIASDGSCSVVTGIYPQGKQDIYRVHFNDKSYVDCTEDHLWLTQTVTEREKHQLGLVRTLAQIRDSLYRGIRPNHYIPLVSADIQFNSSSLAIHPYVLGVILGDGNISQKAVSISCPDAEVIDKVSKHLPDTVDLRQKIDDPITWYIRRKANSGVNGLTSALRSYGLLGHLSTSKFIPDVYLTASKQCRIELLQGLLDTDGYTDGKTIEYSTSSEELAKNVKELVESLGGLAPTVSRIPVFTYKGEKKEGQVNYRLFLRLPANILPFSLSRKKEKYTPKTKYVPYRQIRKIEFIGKHEAQCISIDHPSRLYVTDNYVVTHNTLTSLQVATAIARGNRIALIDTENETASIYAESENHSGFKFYTPKLNPPYTIEVLEDVFLAAEEYVGENGVVIIDSLSPFWEGTGGALEAANNVSSNSKNQNNWNEVTPKVNKAINTICGSKTAHVICTAKVRSETVQEEYLDHRTNRVKTKATKVGLEPRFTKNTEYYFDVAIKCMLITNLDGTDSPVLTVSKPPRFSFANKLYASIFGDVPGTVKWNSEEFAASLLYELDQGEDPDQKSKDKARQVIGELLEEYSELNPEPYSVELNPQASLADLRTYYTKLAEEVKKLKAVPQ